MAFKPKYELYCVKCKKPFYHDENLGTLNCFDTYYSDDMSQSFRVRADHRNTIAKTTTVEIDWMDLVYTMDDCVDVESNILKKMYPQPNRLSIIDPNEFEFLLKQYNEDIMTEDLNFVKRVYPMVVSEFIDEESLDKEEDDEYEYLSDDPNDDVDQQEEYLSSTSSENNVVKQVCIARFDWREKFNVLMRLKKITSEIDYRNFIPLQRIKYTDTIEYKTNPHIRQNLSLNYH